MFWKMMYFSEEDTYLIKLHFLKSKKKPLKPYVTAPVS